MTDPTPAARVKALATCQPYDGDAASCAMCAEAEATLWCTGEAWCEDCHSRETIAALEARVEEMTPALTDPVADAARVLHDALRINMIGMDCVHPAVDAAFQRLSEAMAQESRDA